MGTYRVLVAVLLVVTAGGSVVSAQDAGPSVTVTVDGAELSDGGTVTVTDDPSVTVEATADQPIETVDIRVNGTSRASFEPNASSVSETVTLDLDGGDNQVRVVVTAGEVSSVTGIVRLDAEGPRVAYTSPFSTNRFEGVPDAVTVRNGTVTLAGDVYDTTNVTELTIERTYEYSFGGSSRQSREVYRLDDVGGSFEQELLLGEGTNDVRVQLEDETGHTTVHRFDLQLVDDERPVIEIESVTRSEEGTVRVQGEVRDNVKVNSLQIGRVGSSSSTYLVNPTDPEPERERLSVEFDTTISVSSDTEQIRLRAEDIAGNSRTRTIPVDYTRQIEPSIAIDEDATTLADGVVEISGVVDDGEITTVRAETVAEDGSVVDFTTVYSGDVTERVALDGIALEAATGRTTVRIRVIDSTGQEHVSSLELAGTAPAQVTATPTATVTSTGTATPTATSASITTPPPTATPTATAIEAGGGAGGFPPFSAGTSMNYSLGMWVMAIGLTYAIRNTQTGHFWSRLVGGVSILATLIGGGMALVGGAFPLVKAGAAVVLSLVWWWLLPADIGGRSPSTTPQQKDTTEVYTRGGGDETEVYDPDDGDTEIYDPDDN